MSEGPKKDLRLLAGVIAFGMIAGCFVVAASPWLTGEKEPWDAETNFYYWYVLAVGFIAGIAVPRWFWGCPIGIYLGQSFAAVFTLKLGSTAPVGFVIFLPMIFIIAGTGWLAGAGIRWLTVTMFARTRRIAASEEPRSG